MCFWIVQSVVTVARKGINVFNSNLISGNKLVTPLPEDPRKSRLSWIISKAIFKIWSTDSQKDFLSTAEMVSPLHNMALIYSKTGHFETQQPSNQNINSIPTGDWYKWQLVCCFLPSCTLTSWRTNVWYGEGGGISWCISTSTGTTCCKYGRSIY